MPTIPANATFRFPIQVDQLLTLTGPTVTCRAVLSTQKGGDVVVDFNRQSLKSTPVFGLGVTGIVTITNGTNPLTYDLPASVFPLAGQISGMSKISAGYRNAINNGTAMNRAVWSTESSTWGGTPIAGSIGFTTTGVSVNPVTTHRLYASNGGWAGGGTLNNTLNVLRPLTMEGGWVRTGTGTSFQAQAYISGANIMSSFTQRYRFYTNDPEPVFYVLGNSSSYPIRVDGRELTNPLVSPAGGGLHTVSLNLKGLANDIWPAMPGWHLIEFMQNGQDTVFAGVGVRLDYSIVPTAPRPVVAIFTDSVGNTSSGASPAAARAHYPSIMADMFDVDMRPLSAGGTGYINAGTFETFINRIPLAEIQFRAAGVTPDLVIFAGGTNDSSNSSAAISTAVSRTIDAAQVQWPNTKIAVLGSWSASGAAPQAASLSAELAIASAVSAYSGVAFVPLQSDLPSPWATGTGTVETPGSPPNGTASRWFSNAGGSHPVGVGHRDYGAMLSHRIAVALGL